MLKLNKRAFTDRLKQKWSRFSAWRKVFVILLILFLLFWFSLASLVALPAITSVYFLTMIIKNVMDIHAGWKWGNIFACKKDDSSKVIGEISDSDETIIKFPAIDPRTPNNLKKQARPLGAKPLSANNAKAFAPQKDDQKVIRSVTANKAQGSKPALKGVAGKGEINISKAKPLAGEEKVNPEGDKTVFDKSEIEKDKIFDPSREDHTIKPAKMVDDKKKVANKGKKDSKS